jgi:hypothetical protein
MSQEKLSALLDGECSDAELDALLDELDRAPELKQQWSRLCIAHEARAGTRIRGVDVDIVGNVMAQISRAAPDASGGKVVELASRRRAPLTWRSWGGLAAAAAVAAVAVTLGLNFGALDAGREGQLVASAEGIDTSARLQTADAVDEDLRQYMIEHSNTLADRGVGGTLSYARFAARSSDAAFAQPASYSPDGSQP